MKDREIAGNLDTGMLKIIALICMVMDHVGARLLPGIPELRIIGRVAFPLYLWCMTVGACYTRSPLKYALRLLIVGAISQPFFMLGLNHTWQSWNIFITLLLGYLAILGIRENRYGSRYWAPALCLLATLYIRCDYGWRGVLLAMLLYMCRSRRAAIAAVMVAFCLFWGSTSSSITKVFGIPLTATVGGAKNPLRALLNSDLWRSFLKLQACALLSLPLMLIKRTKRTPFPQWAAYAAYPGHLLLLWVAALLLGVEKWSASLARLIPW